jgi:hypothetical protein
MIFLIFLNLLLVITIRNKSYIFHNQIIFKIINLYLIKYDILKLIIIYSIIIFINKPNMILYHC